MKIDFEGIKLNLIFESEEIDHSKKTIIFFHGFGGSANDWEFIFPLLPENFQVISVDLIGHGKSDSPTNIHFYYSESIINQIREVIKSLNVITPILCGYSMGGRIALGYAIQYPNEISALILESSSPGIIDKKERENRTLSDSRLAERLETIGIEKFFDEWYEQPLFNSLRKDTHRFEKLLNSKLEGNIIGIKNSLKYYSQGLMPSYWDQLNKIAVPLLLISGSLDQKYCNINKKIKSIIQSSSWEIINDAGHNTHLEKPDEFIKLVNKFLKGLS
ncbi:MAG: 2-succinyl-6-hydroxy-2,4-cyclohexadiene-1-carboxylate synthase [Ignavibacteriaceae bacterium]|jgi:2-succinyl-6-hydroxy-2,4-cyclohexadiene-1-carboxylate synthase|nr:2-succinyl-6-hydroxy-2,4-cyclohexadiene-1-carboxylate synthase [Ignavibacteriaceae bacterium]